MEAIATDAITKVIDGQVLQPAEMTAVMDVIMKGQVEEGRLVQFLTKLADRGETAEEVAAAALTMRRHAVPVPLRKPLLLADTCGTGGDGLQTFNVSTLAALVASACGVLIAKHGNRSASGRCGSADVLEALGVKIEVSPERVGRCIEEIGFGFLYARTFHPAMRHAAAARAQIGKRTIFNLLGPLTNPAGPAYQLVGVSEPRFVTLMANALKALGVRHALVVHGGDGLDEVTLSRETLVADVQANAIETYVIRPVTFGMIGGPLEALQGGDASANAKIAMEVLQGAHGPRREVLILNAGCAIYAADRARSIEEGLAMAESALDSGRALAKLEALKRLTRG